MPNAIPGLPALGSPTPAPSPSIAQPSPAVTFRKFGDSAATRKLIYDNVLNAATGLKPMSNQRHTLQLTNVGYEGPEEFSKKDVKAAILGGTTLARRLRGTWQLIDNVTGKPIEERHTTLANVPHLTDDGVFINRGVSYTLAHQLRLSPGIFARQKKNAELEAHVNVLPGKGRGHKLFLDPESGIFKLNLGQANMPLYPLLKAMGAKDADLREAWGNDLAGMNAQKTDPQVIRKLYDRIAKNRVEGADPTTMQQAVSDAFGNMELDDFVTNRTLQHKSGKLDLPTILATTKKLLAINRGEAEPDDRDHMAYQHVLGPEDLLAERLAKSGGELRKLLWKISAKGNLKAVQPGFFDKAIQSAIIGSGLGAPIEEINPAEIFDQQSRLTRMGEGGITSMDAVPEESRAVQPTHLGFVDPLRTPECYDARTEVMTRRGWVFWPEVREDDEFACLVLGRLEYHRATALHRANYVGPMYGASSNRIAYLVTPNHRMWVRPLHAGAQYRIEPVFDTHGSSRRVCSGGFAPWQGDGRDFFVLPQPPHHSNNTSAIVDQIPIGPWAELVGWFIGEGSCRHDEASCAYHVKITQSLEANPDNCQQITQLLRELPFAWSYADSTFVLATKQLSSYFVTFGGSPSRRIPEYLLEAPLHARQRLFDALMKGEGRRDRRGDRTQFCTSSAELSLDFARLAFGLGYATKRAFEPDTRPQSTTGGCWVVHVHKQSEHQLLAKRKDGSDYFVKEYAGEVFCATVPGGLLYVRRHQDQTVGFWCGNSGKVGVDMRLARSAVKGSDGFLYFPLQNTKTGKIEYKSARDLADATIAFSPIEQQQPQEDGPQSIFGGGPIRRNGSSYVNVLAGGKMRYERSDKVDYAIPHFEDTFSPLANMIPLKSMVKGQRAVMAARMVTQALPLEDGEAPLVQSALPENADRSFEEEYAKHMGAVHAEQPARVLSADKDGIVLQHADGTKKTVDLYDNMPYNRKTLISQTPMVKPGDTVQAGQLLARSNYTDAAGVTALGKNLRVAYLPFRGANFEDANVISESAAKRLSSEHAYQHSVDWEDDVRPGKRAFVASFAAKYPRAVLDNFTDDGLIKPGTKVGFGDPLVLSVRERSRTHGAIHRGRRPEFVDESQVWEHHAPGVVTDVVNGKKGATVVVKATIPTQVGDKISGRYGDKGVVSMIVPDDEMPTDEKGKPYEILTNPLGVISRVNSAQLIEAALGKVAAATGKPYKLQDFKSKHDLINFALDELRKNNLSDTEAAIDPETGNKIPNVFAGNRWFMKLHHTSEAKVQGRGIGGYTSEGAPAKGGASGAKRIGMLNLGALLSHGAGKVIREAKMIRGQANPEFWSQFMSGYKPTTPEIPKVYEKFLGMLQGSGIHPLRDGEKTHFMAMTNAKVDELAGPREIRNAETVDWKGGLKPKPGGLFDEALTGGHEGTKWAAIKLHEPLPNPVMEEPIRRVLGITENKMRDVLAGRAELGGITGPRALQKALQAIDLPKAVEQTRLEIKSNKSTVRDAAVRRFGFLKNAERLGIHPGDWMLDRVPVMPPKFRPVTTMGAKKLPLVADANYLYKELLDSNDMLRQMSDKVDDLGDERLATYDAMKAVSGLGEPTHPKNQERGVKGLLKQIFGSSPKFGMIQRKLLSTTTDLVGRAAIIPNPDLDMDSVGLPEEKAWDLYTPYVVRHLVRRGMPRMQAAQRVKDKDPVAKDALVNEMKQRPVMIDRAPVLHRYGVMAFWPRITKGSTMQISPLVVGGFNADFDGDAMQFHLPADDDAAQEMAEKMLPSKNLFSASKFKAHYLPSQEYVGGLYHATTRIDKHNKPAVFETTADAVRAYNQGQIAADRQVHILKP